MIAKNGLLEFGKSQRIGNKGFASIEIDGDAIHGEEFKIMKTQMRYGIEHDGNGTKVFGDVIIPKIASRHGEVQCSHVMMKMNKEACINFASTQDVTGFAWHAASMIFAHPLKVVRIVSASFKLASVPRPKTFALRAKHLIASLSFVNGNPAIWARFCIIFEKGDGSDGVGIANMVGIIAIGLEFPAVGTCVLVADATLPSGRDEAVAVGISAAVNELVSVISRLTGVMTLQLSFCLYEIIFARGEGLYLFIDIPDLIVNVLDELVMNDGGLSCRKHGLFLSKENVLLMLGELASEEGLGKAEVLKLRMGELSAAEEALGNRDIIATEEGLVTGAAGGLGTGIQRTANGFAIGGIEAVKADGTD